MNVNKWIVDKYRLAKQERLSVVPVIFRELFIKLYTPFNIVLPDGENIFDYDWDVLVVVDACRTDLMEEQSDEWDFLDQVSSVRSVESATKYWMDKTFVSEYQDEIAETVYICGNPWSKDVLSEADFSKLVESWRFAWDEPGTVPPEAITDLAIQEYRDSNPDRLLVHYMQPHVPFIGHPDLCHSQRADDFGEGAHQDVWNKLRDGQVEQDEVWDGYADNLSTVLSEIETLLQNISADDVVITSDHGNGIGEWGVYGHPPHLPTQNVRQVPWVRTTATNTGSYTPNTEFENNSSDSIEEKLESLGYL